ncbi:GAF domain-containing protein [Desulfurobacterium atlanticum]|uniref:GAF domain-containing protein n=1 Tax=Desulfurobacterium atlanticum TaxID=240169 RepID=A0A238ZET3_9BACT|nr:GAF domain-containing protein [Desulfurobacterium atlanticum]SNR81518.1 GAF domain-containing protein [Desulfurobacterium atlanticum]
MPFFKKKNAIENFKKLLSKKNYSDAFKIAITILEKDPDNPFVLDEAINILKQLHRKDSLENFILSIAEKKFKDGYYDKAIAILKKGLKEVPSSYSLIKLLSSIYEKKDLYYEALNCVYQGWKKAKEPEKSKLKKLMIEKLTKLLETAEELKKHDTEKLLIYFSNLARKLLNVDRCTIYIADPEKKILWTKIAHGIDKIIIPIDKGFAGYVYRTGESIISNDPYNDRRFFKDVDTITGYKTRNIVTVPIIINGRKIGVFQALNKIGEKFNEDDLSILTILALHSAPYLIESIKESKN